MGLIRRKYASFLNKILRKQAFLLQTYYLHQRTFPQFKNACDGKKLVICGAGPSLKHYKPIEGAIHIALNRAFLYEKVNFDYIFAQDYEGIYMVCDDLISYNKNCIKLLGTQNGNPKKEIPESFAVKCRALRFNTDVAIFDNPSKMTFVKDIDSLPLSNMYNVGLSVLQFAMYMNPAELYIVGCDISGNHFATGSQSKDQIKAEGAMLDKKWKKLNKDLINKWKEFKEFASLYYPDTKIYSINPVGLKGLFEDIYQNND